MPTRCGGASGAVGATVALSFSPITWVPSGATAVGALPTDTGPSPPALAPGALTGGRVS
jgi:hypothetical protein